TSGSLQIHAEDGDGRELGQIEVNRITRGNGGPAGARDGERARPAGGHRDGAVGVVVELAHSESARGKISGIGAREFGMERNDVHYTPPLLSTSGSLQIHAEDGDGRELGQIEVDRIAGGDQRAGRATDGPISGNG